MRRDPSPTASVDRDPQYYDSDGYLVPDVELSVAGPTKTAVSAVKRKRKGTGLEQITQGLGVKIHIHIPEGLKRPEKPMQSAKFASEGGMIARSQMPLYPHFKEYKKDTNTVKNFLGKLGSNFNMDIYSEVIQKACCDILKSVSKNRRYFLKKDYFDKMAANAIPLKSPIADVTDADWQALAALWGTERHRCAYCWISYIIVPIWRRHVRVTRKIVVKSNFSIRLALDAFLLMCIQLGRTARVKRLMQSTCSW